MNMINNKYRKQGVKAVKLLLCAAFFILHSSLFISCDEYLDKLPDDRATVDTPEKVTKLVASAYPVASTILVSEMTADNVTDNGTQYGTLPHVDDMYRFKEVSSDDNDSPRNLWDNYYEAVATANEALQAIRDLGSPAELNAQRGEAMLCRAFGMFQMATVFCMAYDPSKADEYLGLPYPLEPEQSVETQYVRGTLKGLYQHINDDIEEALPLINDAIYSVPKYHFNQRAAYAFAARFNLYYQQWDKVIEYATKALGAVPVDFLRVRAPYSTAAGFDDYFNMYIQSSQACNFMMAPAYSIAARVLTGGYLRYAHNMTILGNETYWAYSPWNPTIDTSRNSLLWTAHSLYGNNNIVMEPKIDEVFEYTDKVNGIGYVHIVDPIFTGDETILCRAEAYAMKGDFAKALADMNTWCSTNLEDRYGSSTRSELTQESVNTFMESIEYSPVHIDDDIQRTIKKTLHPQGFTVSSGDQENLIQLILYMRRVTTIFQGLRFMDVKRYGIEYEHIVDKENPIKFSAGDLRGAIQLPTDVVAAGLERNPRIGDEEAAPQGGEAQIQPIDTQTETERIILPKIQ